MTLKFRNYIASLTKDYKTFNHYHKLWLWSPFFMWFSYQPRFFLGDNQTMNFELSLSLIYIFILAICSLPIIWEHRRKLISSRFVVLVSIFVAWSGLTIIWSNNVLRGLLTFGVIGCLWLAFMGLVASWRQDFTRIACRLLILSSVVASAMAIGQIILGTYFVDYRDAWLCTGCAYWQFGFVRPNLFAVEPQFLGNLLLVPTLIMFYLISRKWHNARVDILLLLTVVLGLTLSRGAVYSLLIGVIIILLLSENKETILINKLTAFSLLFVSGIIVLLVQGSLAVSNPKINESFWGSITKSVSQMSLGIVNGEDKRSNSSGNYQGKGSPKDSPKPSKPIFDGYVVESTNVRVNLSKTALSAWVDQGFWGRLVGSGLGSSGKKISQYVGSKYEKEIVQNEFIEVLLERGLIGLILLILIISALIRRAWWSQFKPLAVAIILALSAQYMFFSGLPNSLHVFLWIVILYCTTTSKYLPNSLKQDLNI